MKILVLVASSLLIALWTQYASAADGKALYRASCIACHGEKGQGAIPGVPDLARSGRMSKTDQELVDSILKGYRTKGSPMAMPPKGGNPKLTEEDARAIVVYLRSIAKSPKKTP
jgi:mono/diheme cytochrome c family protein